jgi:hypothetical protein
MIRNWYRRWAKRQSDLARGVDASLVRSNRWRFKAAGLLLAASSLTALAFGGRDFPAWAEWPVRVVIAVGVASGLILLRWAQQERIRLEKADPEKPPSILGRD